MNVLVATKIYSADHIWGVSVATCYHDMIHLVNRVRDDVHWFFAVPETPKNVAWSPEDFKHLKNVTILPVLHDEVAGEGKGGFGKTDYPFFSPKMLDLFVSEEYYKFDVLISRFAHAQYVPLMQSLPSIRSHHLQCPIGHPTIVNHITETWVDKRIPPLDSSVSKLLYMASAAVSDVTLVFSDVDVHAVKLELRNHLAPSLFLKTDVRCMFPTVSSELIPNHVRPKNRKTFFHGGTFEAKRHLQWISNSLVALKGMYPDLRILFTTQRGSLPKWTDSVSNHVEIVTKCTRDEYHNRLADGDFLLCYLDYEGTGIGYLEAILSGMTPIIMRRPWNKGRFLDTYPFYCKGETEFAQALAYCAKHPEKAKQVGQRCIDDTRNRFSLETQALRWSMFLDEMAEIRNQKTRALSKTHVSAKIIREAAQNMPDIISGEEALKLISKTATKLDESHFRTNWWRTRQVLMAEGFCEIEGGTWKESRFKRKVIG